MKLPASVLKNAVKRLAPAGAGEFLLDTKEGVLTAIGAGIVIRVHDIEFTQIPGDAVGVNAKQFTAVVNRARGTVDLSVANPVKIKGTAASFEIATVAKPPVFPTQQVDTFRVPLAFLQDAVTFTSQVTSKTTPTYGGAMLLKVLGGKVGTITAAVAGGRAIPVISRPYPSTIDRTILIPLQTFAAIKVLEGAEVEIGENDRGTYIATVETPETVGRKTAIFAQKQSAEFPDLTKPFPAAYSFEVQLDAEEMREALADVAAVSDDALGVVDLSFEGAVLTMRTKGGNDSAQTQVKIGRKGKADAGDFLSEDDIPFRVLHHHRVLAGFFGQVKSGEIQYRANEATTPALLQCATDDGTDLKLLVSTATA